MITFLVELERARRTYYPSPEERSMTTFHPDPNDPDDDDEGLPPKPGPERDLPEEGDLDGTDDPLEDVPDDAFLPPNEAREDDTIDDEEDDSE